MVVENAYFHNVVKCGARVRGSLGGMIFDKSLRLGSAGAPSSRDKDRDKDGKKGDSKDPRRRAAEGAGGVLNLMTSDAANIEALTLQLHTVWDGLLQIAIYVTLLYRYLGPSVLYGVAVLLTTVPLNAATLRVVNRLNAREMESRDDRMRKTTESIGSMDVLKAAAWDGYFLRDVRGHRDEELRRHARRGSVRALNQAVSNTIPTATLVVTLAMYARSGRPPLEREELAGEDRGVPQQGRDRPVRPGGGEARSRRRQDWRRDEGRERRAGRRRLPLVRAGGSFAESE
ncbi:hypothetical protein THAOC_10805, partial [Thalassiosira oceanica]